jgi:hypothetical protein
MWQFSLTVIIYKILEFLKKYQKIAASVVILSVAAITFFYNYQHVLNGQVNDAMVELVQAHYLKLNRLVFFVDNYPGGNAMGIESLVPYLNKLIWQTFSITHYEVSTYIMYFLSFLITLYIVYKIIGLSNNDLVIKNPFQYKLILFIFLLFVASSSLIGHIGTIFTRNGISLLWSSLSVLGFVYFLSAESENKKNKNLIYGFAIFLISFIAGVWSYSAFKPYFAAYYSSWILFYVLTGNVKANYKKIIILALASLVLYLISLNFAGGSLKDALLRGNYVVGDLNLKLYLKRFFYTLIMPFFTTSDNSFYFSEVVQESYNKPMLSYVMSIFFIIGTLGSIKYFKKDIFCYSLIAWTIGSFFFGLAGPSIKYNYVMYIFPLLICFRGMEFSLLMLKNAKINYESESVKNIMVFTIILMIAIHLRQEWSHLFYVVPTDDRLKYEVKYGYSSKEAIRSAIGTQESPTFFVSNYSVDSIRFFLRDYPYVYVHARRHIYSSKEYFSTVVNREIKDFNTTKKMQIICQDDPCYFLSETGYSCEKIKSANFLDIKYYYFECNTKRYHDPK